MAKKHTVELVGPTGRRVGRVIRSAEKDTYFDDDIHYEWKARGNVRDAAEYAGDPDTTWFRGRRSAGWKNSKNRHQWEHRISELEKKEKRRAKKARRFALADRNAACKF